MPKQHLPSIHKAKDAGKTALASGIASVPPAISEMLTYGMDYDLLAAHEALGRMQSFLMLQPTSVFIFRTLARLEATRSNSIEGIECSMHEMLIAEINDATNGRLNPADMALKYLHALDTGLAQVNKDGISSLSIKLIQSLHQELLQDTGYHDVPGGLRQVQNWIGGSNITEAKFVPPPACDVPELIADLEQYLQFHPEGLIRQSTVVRLAVAHAQFETIHPFLDGNGRVGRMLMPLILLADGYPPLCLSSALKQHQRQYYEMLFNVQVQGKWPEWIKFIAQIVQLSCDELISKTKELLALDQSWEDKLLHTNKDSTARRLAKLLIEQPIISVKSASEQLGVSFVSANNAIKILVEQKILEVPKTSRNRVFVANQVMSILD